MKADNNTALAPATTRYQTQEVKNDRPAVEPMPGSQRTVDSYKPAAVRARLYGATPTPHAPAGQPAWSLEAGKRAAVGGPRIDPAQVKASLKEVRAHYQEWKASHPDAPEPTDGKYTMGDVVNGNMPQDEQCMRLVLMLLKQSPSTVDDLVAAAPSADPSSAAASSGAADAPAQDPTQATAPAQPAGDPLGGFMQALGPMAQMLGPVAQILGGVLMSPLGPMIIGAAACAIPPPVGEAIAPFAATIAPIAGAALMGLGGVASSQAAGAPAAGAPAAGAPAGGVDVNGIANAATALAPAITAVAGAL